MGIDSNLQAMFYDMVIFVTLILSVHVHGSYLHLLCVLQFLSLVFWSFYYRGLYVSWIDLFPSIFKVLMGGIFLFSFSANLSKNKRKQNKTKTPFSSMSYITTSEFCVLIFCPVVLLNVQIRCNGFLVEYLRCFKCRLCHL